MASFLQENNTEQLQEFEYGNDRQVSRRNQKPKLYSNTYRAEKLTDVIKPFLKPERTPKSDMIVVSVP
jgi:hypothetical protein